MVAVANSHQNGGSMVEGLGRNFRAKTAQNLAKFLEKKLLAC